MSPKHFREFFYPGLCRVMRRLQGTWAVYVIKHTDGKLWPIIDMIIDSGIDCLDPIDPVAEWTWEKSKPGMVIEWPSRAM